MSEFAKHYVGLDTAAARDNGARRPVSRVTLQADGEHVYTAGDDTGLELSAPCPHATQAMADALLARFKGYRYRMYAADGAALDPAAELGDGVTVDGMYGLIARLGDDGSGFPDAEAPGRAEAEDEFPAAGPLESAVRRELADTRASISKTSGEILLQVERTYATQSALANVSVQAEKIGWLVKSGTSGSDFEMTDRAMKLAAQSISLEGYVTFSELSGEGETSINGSNIVGGQIVLGGTGSDAGSMEVRGEAGEILGRFNKYGIFCQDIRAASLSVGDDWHNEWLTIKRDRIDFCPDQNCWIAGHHPSDNMYTDGVDICTNGTLRLASSLLGDMVLMDSRYRRITVDLPVTVNGDVTVTGQKNRAVATADYGARLQYNYETASPLFGDVGQGETDGSGACYVFLEDVFAQTVSPTAEYQVFLQREGPGDLWVAEKTPRYFLVRGAANTRFAWEIKARQRDYVYERLSPAERPETALAGDMAGHLQRYDRELRKLLAEREALLYETA